MGILRRVVAASEPHALRMAQARRAALAGVAALLSAAPGLAQSGEATTAPAKPAAGEEEILVTSSRIERPGFDAPTPTTVISGADLLLGNRPSITQVLNDLPQFRGTFSPATTTGNTNNSASPADLRGLGAVRTLTLLNGRRFVGSGDLNSVPQVLIKRVDVVTGGASAAWGSGAVAGVVNLLLDKDYEGVSLVAGTGISSRGDAARQSVDAAFGTPFAGGRGHVLLAAQFLKEDGAFGRNDGKRPWMDSSLFVTPAGQLTLANDVNFLDATPGGVIRSGPLAGQAFQPDGSLAPVVPGAVSNATNTIGGNTRNPFDYIAVTSPYERWNAFGRLSHDVGEAAEVWMDVSYTRVSSVVPFFPEAARAQATAGGYLVSVDNPFLRPDVRAQLAGGPSTFRLGRLLADIGDRGFLNYKYQRDTLDAAVGLDGTVGSWRYSAWFGHGQIWNNDALRNQRITANFNNAIDVVASPLTGRPVCRVALVDPSTACRPINLFGEGNISDEAVAYAFGEGGTRTVTRLDSGGVILRGDAFSTWAGPVSLAVGAEARRESLNVQVDPLSQARALGTVNFSALSGAFEVKEAFVEALVPLVNVEGVAVLQANGAARYSDYTNSGGIWSWKVGGTLQLFDQLLLRAVASRDIRSPTVAELFTPRVTNLQPVSDPFRGGAVVNVLRYGGGNPDLVPETARTVTLGGSWSPRFVSGLRLSVDYFRIDIDKVIGGLSAQDIVNQCFAGDSVLCNAIVRDADGTLLEVFATNLNLAAYKTRGVDFEVDYGVDLAAGGRLSFRGLATYVDQLIIDDGLNRYDRAGDVGEVPFSTPKWRATGTVRYQGPAVGADVRVRYVDGGTWNSLLAIANNRVASRTYVDVGANVTAGALNFFVNVNNLFDRAPTFVSYTNANYDMIGRYFSAGVRARF